MSNAIIQARVILEKLEGQIKEAQVEAARALAAVFGPHTISPPWEDDEPALIESIVPAEPKFITRIKRGKKPFPLAKRAYKKKAKYWANPTKKRGKKNK